MLVHHMYFINTLHIHNSNIMNNNDNKKLYEVCRNLEKTFENRSEYTYSLQPAQVYAPVTPTLNTYTAAVQFSNLNVPFVNIIEKLCE